MTTTDAITKGAAKRPDPRPFSADEIAARTLRLEQLLAKFDAMPTVDPREPDEIIGFNSQGRFD